MRMNMNWKLGLGSGLYGDWVFQKLGIPFLGFRSKVYGILGCILQVYLGKVQFLWVPFGGSLASSSSGIYGISISSII